MDETPYDFSERVAALWKCCEDRRHGFQCFDSTVPDCQWTRKAEKKRIYFYIGCENGTWKYTFADRADLNKLLTLEQMLAYPNLKNVTIETILVYDKQMTEHLRSVYKKSPLVDANMERLMKCVAYLANDAPLTLELENAENLNTREGKCLLRSLSNMKISAVRLFKSFPVYNQLLQNQFPRRNPTYFIVHHFGENSAFFGKHLKNGNMTRFSDQTSGERFPADVMEGIINSFLKNPERYDKRYFHISAHFFVRSTKALLKRKLKDGSCYRDAYGEYSFTGYSAKLQTHQCLSVNNCGESEYVCTLRAL